jgi:hypothetical protein
VTGGDGIVEHLLGRHGVGGEDARDPVAGGDLLQPGDPPASIQSASPSSTAWLTGRRRTASTMPGRVSVMSLRLRV